MNPFTMDVRLPVPLLEFAPRRLVVTLLGERLRLDLSPEQIEGEVRISNKRYFAVSGDWDKDGSDPKAKATHAIMEAVLAGHGSALWLRQREKLLAGVRKKPLKRSNNWTLNSPADVDAYLEYCNELAHAVIERRLKDRHLPFKVAIGRGMKVFRTGDGRHRLSAALWTGTPLTGYVSHIHSDVLRKMSIVGALSKLDSTCQKR